MGFMRDHQKELIYVLWESQKGKRLQKQQKKVLKDIMPKNKICREKWKSRLMKLKSLQVVSSQIFH